MNRLLLALLLILSALVVFKRPTAPPAASEPVPEPKAAGTKPASPRRPAVRPGAQVLPADSMTRLSPTTSLATSIVPLPSAGPSHTPVIDRLVRLEARRKLAQSIQYTYLDSMITTPDSIVRRWSDQDGQPIKIGIMSSSARGFSPRLTDQVRQAMRTWEGLGLGIHFVETADSSAADVLVSWVEKFEQDRTGQADVQSSGAGVIFSARVTLALQDRSGRTLSDSEIGMIALHELGHAIGLPHSGSKNDIMFPVAMVPRLSDRDRATATLLYSLTPGSMREPPA